MERLHDLIRLMKFDLVQNMKLVTFRTSRGIIVDPEGKGDLDHWKLSARNLLVGLICHMHYAHSINPYENAPLTLNQLASTLKNSLVPDPDNPGNYKSLRF